MKVVTWIMHGSSSMQSGRKLRLDIGLPPNYKVSREKKYNYCCPVIKIFSSYEYQCSAAGHYSYKIEYMIHCIKAL